MFTIKERCTLQPLAKSGGFARPFIVELRINLLNLKRIDASVFVLDDDGLETKVADGVYEIAEDLAERFKAKLREMKHERE